MRAWGSIVVRDGRPQETHRALSLYASCFLVSNQVHSQISLTNALPALRRLRIRERISLQPHRLQHRVLLPKLRRFHRRRISFSHRLRSPRCHQNPHPEPKFREPGVGVQDRGLDDEERGLHEFLQGADAEAVDDGAEAGV